MKKISIVTACYNEEDNVEALYRSVKNIMVESLANYKYEHLFIDNCFNDKTVDLLRKIAAEDKGTVANPTPKIPSKIPHCSELFSCY